jgi:nicotinamidase-related amidase
MDAMHKDSALIVIDLQRGAFDGVRWAAISEPQRLLGNALALLSAARSVSSPVIFVRHCAGAGDVFEEGAIHGELHESLAPRSTETVLKKYASSAFENTDLQATLNALGVKALVVCGLQSEFCVTNTVKSALGLGFGVVVASDAHSTWPSGEKSASGISAAVNDSLQIAGATLRSTAEIVRSLRETRT